MENQPPIIGRPWFRLLSQVRADSALQPAQPAPSASRPSIQQPPVTLARPTVPQPQPQPLPPQTQTPPLPLQSPQPQPSTPLSQVPPPPQTTIQPQPSAPLLQVPPPPRTTVQPQPLDTLSQVPPPPQGRIQPQRLDPLSQVPPPPQGTIRQPQPSPLTQGTTPPISSVGTVEPPRIVKSPTITVPSSRTPPQSPRDIKTSSPTPPLSLMVKQLQPLPPAQPTVNPEPEPKPTLLPPQAQEPKNTAASAEAIKVRINSHSQADLRAPPTTKNDDKNAALDAKSPLKAAASKKEEATMSIITLAGDNTGAYMELRPHQYHQHQHSRKKQGEHSSPGHDDKADTEGRSEVKAAKAAATKNKSISTHVNSNVQSVNNSILFNSSCTAHSPGVHIVLKSHRGKSRTLIPPSKGGNQLPSGTSAANYGH